MTLTMTPGAGEVIENVIHLLSEGHGAHAVDDAEHAPDGDEHGCTGTFHACSCHSLVLFSVSTADATIASALSTTAAMEYFVDALRADGYPASLQRPPRA